MGGDAVEFLSDYHQSRTQVCVNPCSTPRRREMPILNEVPTLERASTAAVNESSLFARVLGESDLPWRTGPDGEPAWCS
jgi:hypothetical protein